MICGALEQAKKLQLEQYYIGAGCIAQTVWNFLFQNPPEYGIKDIDFIYFDGKALDYESENRVALRAKDLFAGVPTEIDVKNEARVHLWYKSRFGYEIPPYRSLEDAIRTWPTTATAVGVRKREDGGLTVFAPFGLEDLFAKTVRANKAQITREIYEKKTAQWLQKWPGLNVVPW